MKRLALTSDYRLTYCSAKPENIGKGRCNHIAHQKDGQSAKDFLEETKDKNKSYFTAKRLWVDSVFIGMKIENRNVTFSQTKQILEGAVTPEGISVIDMQSILDSRDAMRYMLNSLYEDDCFDYAAKIQSMLAAHEALIPGVIRNGNVSISGVKYKPPIPDRDKVDRIYKNIVDNISSSPGYKDNVISNSLDLFSHMTREQWFWDGNKRTAIMMVNKLLITHNCGFLLLNEESIDRFNSLLADYYESGCFEELKEFMKSCIIDD